MVLLGAATISVTYLQPACLKSTETLSYLAANSMEYEDFNLSRLLNAMNSFQSINHVRIKLRHKVSKILPSSL
jgi:hypothetical protein